MPTIARTLLAILTIGISSCASVITGTSLVTRPGGGQVLFITNSPGGNVEVFDQAFKKLSRIAGISVEIRRWCASACTQVLGYFPPEQICLWPGARLAFHSAVTRRRFTPWYSANSSIPDASSNTDSISTLMMFNLYPGWLQSRLQSSGIMIGGVENPSAIIEAPEFWKHGYGICRNDLRAATGERSIPIQGG